MNKKKISRIILKDENEEPVGMLSFKDRFKTTLRSGNKILKNQKPNLPVIVFRKSFHLNHDLKKACKIMMDKKLMV